MQLAQVHIVANPLTAEPSSGSFVRVWRTVPEKPVDWLSPVRWTGQWLHKVGGQVFPVEGDGEIGVLTTEALISKLRDAATLPSALGMSIFMHELDAFLLLPEMVMPRVPIDVTAISINDELLDLTIGRLSHSLKLPPFERVDGVVKRKGD